MNTWQMTICGLAGGLAISSAASATINPFTETFSGPSANWATAASGPGVAPLTYVGSGGPDGSAYGSGSFGFAATTVGAFPILFRSQDSFDSSGDAFVGSWLGSGVDTFSFSVRHNAPGPVTFFARFVGIGAFTGVVYQAPVSVPAGQWATFDVPVNMATPFIYEGAPTLFGSTFSNIDRVQIGLVADAAIAGQAGPYVFDVDNVSITPAPGAFALLAGAGLIGLRRRRN